MLQITAEARALIGRQARTRTHQGIALFTPWPGYRAVARVFAAWRDERRLRDDPAFISLQCGVAVPVYADERVVSVLRARSHELHVARDLFVFRSLALRERD